MRTRRTLCAAGCVVLAAGLAARWAAGNGGPFVVKYPSGDPAAKGVLARLDPSLKPARETRLRVVKEDLTVRFGTSGTVPRRDRRAAAGRRVGGLHDRESRPTRRSRSISASRSSAASTSCPGDGALRPTSASRSTRRYVQPTVISNSVIYGLIRQNAREVIEKGIAGDGELRGGWRPFVRRGNRSRQRKAAGPSRPAPRHREQARLRPSGSRRPPISRPARTCGTT